MVLDSLPVAGCAVDRDGKVILWNDGAERVTGYLRQDGLGRLCTEAFLDHADTENNPMEANAIPLLETIQDGRCLTVRASWRRKSGQSVGVHVRTVPLPVDDGWMQGAAELFEEMITRTPTDRSHNKLAVAGCMDQLTGILNHSMILAQLQEALSLHKVYPVPFCALCISTDGMSKIRERFGQAAVDATLHVVAQTLERALRPTDFLGRWLEQEFLAVLTECNESDIAKVGDRLRKMAQRAHVSWWGDTWSVMISIGATQVLDMDMDMAGGMVNRAEEGIRKSDDNGGNQVVVVTH